LPPTGVLGDLLYLSKPIITVIIGKTKVSFKVETTAGEVLDAILIVFGTQVGLCIDVGC